MTEVTTDTTDVTDRNDRPVAVGDIGITLPRLNSIGIMSTFYVFFYFWSAVIALYYDNPTYSVKIQTPPTARQHSYRYHRLLRADHYGRWCRWWLQSYPWARDVLSVSFCSKNSLEKVDTDHKLIFARRYVQIGDLMKVSKKLIRSDCRSEAGKFWYVQIGDSKSYVSCVLDKQDWRNLNWDA